MRFIAGHYRRRRADGEYRYVYLPDHESATSYGCVAVHILTAEKALGHRLPVGAKVHHVDTNKQNNAPNNLVICQDAAYHSLLHFRMRVVRAGGNPNTQKVCGMCGQAKDFAAFHADRHNNSGLQGRCRACMQDHHRRKVLARKGDQMTETHFTEADAIVDGRGNARAVCGTRVNEKRGEVDPQAPTCPICKQWLIRDAMEPLPEWITEKWGAR